MLKQNYVLHESYIEKYAYDNDFQDVYASLRQGNQIEELDYHVHNSLLYQLGKLCIPQREKKQYHKGGAHFINCWTLWCRQDNRKSPKVLLLATHV